MGAKLEAIELAADEVIALIVQLNGRLRARLTVPADISEQDAKDLATADENVQRFVEGKQIVKLIYVPGRLVNIVMR